jgi:purine-binding chemotaxis protein CheW
MSIFDRFSEEELAILKARAERVAYAADDDDIGNLMSVLKVGIGNEMYALPVESLTAVYEHISVVPVPCTPGYVSGIANIRGHILPVLNLSILLGMSAPEAMSEAKLIVADYRDMTVAFQVSSVGDIVSIPGSEIDNLPGNIDGRASGYIQGLLADGTALLNTRAIFEDPSLTVAASVRDN